MVAGYETQTKPERKLYLTNLVYGFRADTLINGHQISNSSFTFAKGREKK